MKKKTRKESTSETLGSAVQALRDSLHLSQGEMASKLGLTRSAISACELGRIALAPRALIKLAAMAPDEAQRAFFLSQAGLDEQAITSAAKAIFNRQRAPAKPDETVRVPPMPRGKDLGEFFLDSRLAPGSGFVQYLVVQEEQEGNGFSAGDIVFIEAHAGDPSDPTSLWDAPLLAQFTDEGTRFPWFTWRDGLYVGVLGCKQSINKGAVCYAVLGGLNDHPTKWSIGWPGTPMGVWQHPILSQPSPNSVDGLTARHEAERRAAQEAVILARKRMRLSKGWKILGRVIAWIPQPEDRR